MNKNRIFDELLVLKAQDGNKEALGLLVQRWNTKLISFSSKYTRSADQARDIVQDSWISILRGISRLNTPSKFPSWAFRIVYNKTMDDLKIRQEVSLDTNQEYADESMPDEVLDIKTELLKLTANHKTILNLFYLEGLSVKEISKSLNISQGTVKSRIFYAREKLKKNLKLKL